MAVVGSRGKQANAEHAPIPNGAASINSIADVFDVGLLLLLVNANGDAIFCGSSSFLCMRLGRGRIQTWTGLNPLCLSRKAAPTERPSGEVSTPYCFFAFETQGVYTRFRDTVIHNSRLSLHVNLHGMGFTNLKICPMEIKECGSLVLSSNSARLITLDSAIISAATNREPGELCLTWKECGLPHRLQGAILMPPPGRWRKPRRTSRLSNSCRIRHSKICIDIIDSRPKRLPPP